MNRFLRADLLSMSGGPGAEPEVDLAGHKSLYDAVIGRSLRFDIEGWVGTAEGIVPSWIPY